ncbi:MAG: transcriptional coactivator hfi1/ADA1 [Phylliscum demangeonii]|nr:MAG: transcriptional coactivator hfi1/ADA1 [Phylliscum demangeonii]
MPDIDPAALSRPSSISQPPSSSIPPLKPISTAIASAYKPSKVMTFAQRIDLEPIYTALKAAIGEDWVAYKEAVSLYVLGQLNQEELSSRIDHLLEVDPSREHLHNQLISAIYGNVVRDLPDQNVASWVSANDKPTNVSKPASGDLAEQRLKMEAMSLPARDRRRLKDIVEVDPNDVYSDMLNEYHQAKQIRQPDIGPVGAGGQSKTNWEMEIRKRYAQPLACETGEFPDAESIYSRMIPICYEEGIVGGASESTAAYINVATEIFIKEMLSRVLERNRSNGGPNYITTAAYRQQLAREDEGDAQKNTNGLLPIEQATFKQRPALSIADFRLSIELGDSHLGHMPLTVARIMGDYLEDEFYHEDDDDDSVDGRGMGMGMSMDIDRIRPAVTTINGLSGIGMNGALHRSGGGATTATNGNGNGNDDMNLDDSDWGWEGGGTADREALAALLDECLAVG